ncbi:hypothetical protein [Streptomyces sp. NBC_00076]|uniref:DUF7848 domain-containing protein n=1 Tax=Streptomyces sp. NBC_00076 TaxID=2975642 RepID=UPI003251AE14
MTILPMAPTMTLKPSGIPVNQFIECARCLAHSADDSSAQEWAEGHHTERPGHDTFRTVSTSSWRLTPKRSTP